MRSLLLLLSSVLIFSANAQTWTEQTSNTTAELVAIHFYNSSTGVAVGGGGTVVFTADGGDTWTPTSAGADYDMLSADFTGDIIYVGGEMATTGDGFIIKSDDRGQNWTPQTTTLPERILGISFTDASYGWGGGRKGLLLKTTDGGQNWTDGNSPTPEDITAVFFWDANTGWIADEDGFIYYTTNGGTSWTTQSTGADKDLYDIQFVNANEGFAGGKNANLLHSVDGGANWTAQAATQEDVMAIYMLSKDNVWVAATGGEILQTNDAGTNWINTGDAALGELADIFMVHDSLGWVCGAAGVIAKLKGENGGGGNNLQASFTTDNEACLDEELTFTDNSQGDAISWEWDFGDGSAVATTQNASHTFSQTGQYTITLTIEDAQGNTDQNQQIVNIHAIVTADFTMSLDTIDLNKGNSVMLTNNSQNAISYDWDYGNGQGSQTENPIATYSSPGTYTIQLTAMNPGCEDQAEKTIVVINPTGMEATSNVDVNIYPNPATDHIQVKTGEAVKSIRIINLIGTTVYHEEIAFSNEHVISLNEFSPGTYFLIMETNSGTAIKKILKR